MVSRTHALYHILSVVSNFEGLNRGHEEWGWPATLHYGSFVDSGHMLRAFMTLEGV